MSLIARFAAKKAGNAPTPETAAAEATVETQIHMPEPETAAAAPAKRSYVRKAPTNAYLDPAPVAVPAVKVDAPKAEPVATRALAAFDPFSIITGSGADDANSVMEMILAKAEEQGDRNFDGVFPLVKLTKGNSGGSWSCGSNVSGEEAAVLPVATKPFTAVFLGYRIYGVAWETSMQGHDAAGGDENKAKPIWKVGSIASADKALVQAALDAGENYQFTPGAQKGEKFDGLGHFRPGVEFLFYRKGVVFAVRLPDHYNTTIRALESLGGIMRGLGGLRAVPLIVTPYSTDEKGAKAWKCHSLRFEIGMTAEGKSVGEEFNSIKADLMADEQFSADFRTWNTSDVEEAAVGALKEIASMKKGR